MKARLALLIIVLAAIGVALVILLFPPAKRPEPSKPPAQQPKPEPKPEPKPAPASPRQVVSTYLTALEKQDYRAAYVLLSAQSREERTPDQFAAACREAGSPSLDASAAVEQRTEGARVVVMVPIVQDTAAASFTLAQEEGQWRIIYHRHSPWFPYPD